MLIETMMETYDDLGEFLCSSNHADLFKNQFGFNPSATNIRQKLKTNKNFQSDMSIIKKVLSIKSGRYIVGEFESNEEIWIGHDYTLRSEYKIFVHTITEKE